MFFRGYSMKLFTKVILAAITLTAAVAPATAAPATVGRPLLPPVVPATQGMPPDLIILRFIGGRTLEVSNPSRAVGGRPHEVVAAEKGISLPCQAWRPIAPPQGFGFAAEITQTCGN